MSRCYYLEYYSEGTLRIKNDYYFCKLTGQRFDFDDPRVKFICNAEWGEKYRDCPVYKNNR